MKHDCNTRQASVLRGLFCVLRVLLRLANSAQAVLRSAATAIVRRRWLPASLKLVLVGTPIIPWRGRPKSLWDRSIRRIRGSRWERLPYHWMVDFGPHKMYLPT